MSNISRFRKFLEDQGHGDFFGLNNEPVADPNAGRPARSRVSERKLVERMETSGDAEEIALDFVENGGTVVSMEDDSVVIETSLGQFSIPRFCVKIKSQS